MKKRIIAIITAICMVLTIAPVTAAPAFAADGDVAINEANFPDSTFRTYVSDNFDKDDDSVLSEAEINAILKINVAKKNITSLKGIEHFVKLQELDCSNNQITSLDLSKNTAMRFLTCNNNALTSLDVSQLTILGNIKCDGNQLKTLDISKNTVLMYLSCSNNQLTSLDLSQNKDLTGLNCENNNLYNLDLSQNKYLDSTYRASYWLLGGNPYLALNYNYKMTTMYKASYGSFKAVKAFDAGGTSIKLADYGVNESRIVSGSLTGATITNGVMTANAGSTSASYKYYVNAAKTLSTTFKVSFAQPTDITKDSKFKVVYNSTYDGSAVKPTVAVSYDGTALKEGTDFTVTYKDIVEPGTYEDAITITGMGKYAGTKTYPVTINKKAIDFSKYDPLLVFDYTYANDYTGKVVKPEVKVTYVGTPLVEGVDYEITYEKYSAPGFYDAAIKLVGKGDYTGTKKLSFSIRDPELGAATIKEFRLATSNYNKAYVDWSTVKYGDATVKYKLEYSYDKKSWTAKKTSKSSYTISSLKSGKKVYVRVTPYASIEGKTYYGDTVQAENYVQIIKAPSQKSVAKTKSKTKVKVSWSKVTGASGYYIYKATSKSGKYSKVATVTSGKSVSKTVKATKGKTNYYKVKAYVKLKVGKKTYYITSPYSSVKSIKVKK